MNTVELKSFIASAESAIGDPSPGERGDQYEQLLIQALAYLKATLPADSPECPFEGIVAAYQLTLPMLAPCSKLTTTRRTQLLRRWNEEPERQSLAWWRNYFKRAATSDFLTGRSSNDRGWKADFDFFLQPKSMIKILEGAYGIGSGRNAREELMDDVAREQNRRLLQAARGISE
jgi:hypothetical protein